MPRPTWLPIRRRALGALLITAAFLTACDDDTADPADMTAADMIVAADMTGAPDMTGAADTGPDMTGAADIGPDMAEAPDMADAPDMAPDMDPDPAPYTLTLLHSNDGESALLPADNGFGGIARYTTLALRERATAEAAGHGVIHVTSGDNFLAGATFSVGLDRVGPLFDALALARADFDAMCLGNHDFDFGPDVLARFITDLPDVPFLSANLDFTAEPALAALVAAGRIAPSTIITTAGRPIGIIGATTEALAEISSPRDVVIEAVAPAVQAEVEALTAAGIDIIVLISHLQSVNNDLELAATLRGIDVMIAGGGDDLLARPDSPLLPEDVRAGDYPTITPDATGTDIPVVTTSGSYRYLGRLTLDFDAAGNLTAIDPTSGPLRVAPEAEPDGVLPDPATTLEVIEPLQAALATLEIPIGATEVPLDGVRARIRTQETNLGNLVADAFLTQATALAPGFGVDIPTIAITNGGGIRNDSIIAIGPLTELNTFNILPFGNFLTIVPAIDGPTLKAILENAVSQVEDVGGRFAHVAGLRFEWDPAGTPRTYDAEGQPIDPGSRIQRIELTDGTLLLDNGVFTPAGEATTHTLATLSFLARGGDGYPLAGRPFTTLGVTDQQALRAHIAGPLQGTITAAAYPEAGEARITRRAQ